MLREWRLIYSCVFLEAVFGFERVEYTVNEEDGSVEVCVVVLEPDEIGISFFSSISTIDNTAQGNEYTYICVYVHIIIYLFTVIDFVY